MELKEEQAMGIEMMKSDDAIVLNLCGSWTIARANDLKQTLMEALDGSSRIVVSPAALEEVDLSCLQLLCAAHRKALNLGKVLILHEEKSDAFVRLAREAGFLRTLGCHENPKLSCLWTGWPS